MKLPVKTVRRLERTDRFFVALRHDLLATTGKAIAKSNCKKCYGRGYLTMYKGAGKKSAVSKRDLCPCTLKPQNDTVISKMSDDVRNKIACRIGRLKHVETKLSMFKIFWDMYRASIMQKRRVVYDEYMKAQDLMVDYLSEPSEALRDTIDQKLDRIKRSDGIDITGPWPEGTLLSDIPDAASKESVVIQKDSVTVGFGETPATVELSLYLNPEPWPPRPVVK